MQEKYKRFQSEYDNMAANQEKFLKQHEEEIERMKEEEEGLKAEGGRFEKRTDHMTKIKLKSYGKAKSMKLLRNCFRGWRQETNVFI
jgi:hypothetical protein